MSRGDWMQTFTGRQFYPMDPHPNDVELVDIAHALSLLCRYNGHVTRFYSVAEHCVLMSRAVSPKNALWALLHDATEAYVGDMIRPLKRSMPQYRAAEDGVMRAISARFGVEPWMPEEVHEADSRILLTERDALMRPSGHEWGIDHLVPLPVTIHGWSPSEAESQYFLRFDEVTR